MLFLTIPTANSHPELLRGLLESCGLPPERVILIATRPGLDLPPAVVIEDFGAPNIQRWWNTGIEEAVRRGATSVAVSNDDVRIGSGALQQLDNALRASGATLSTPSRPPARDRVHKGRLLPYSPRIWGCLWVLDTTSSLRPDPEFVWWYGDVDLDIRARRDFDGIISVPVEFENVHSGEATMKSEALMTLANADAQTYQHKYARLITLTTWLNKVRTFVGLAPIRY